MYTPAQQSMINVIQSNTAAAVSGVTASVDSQTAMMKYYLAKTGQTQTSPATAASELNLATQSGVLAIQQANNAGTMALAQYEQSIQAGDIQAAQDQFNNFEKSQEDITSTLHDLFTAVSTYQNNKQKNDIALQKLQIDNATLSEKINQDSTSDYLKQQGLDLTATIAGTPKTVSTQKGNTGFLGWRTWLTGTPPPSTVTTQEDTGSSSLPTFGLSY